MLSRESSGPSMIRNPHLRLLRSAITQDHVLRALVVPGLVTARRLAPWRYRIPPAGGLAFATAVWMIHRIHRHAADMRSNSLPSRTAGFAVGNVFVLDIAHLPDRRPAHQR